MTNLCFKNYIKFDPEILSEPERDSPEINNQFDKICEEISKQSDVETLDLSGNTLSEYQIKKLANVLEPHKQLVILDLEYNRIGLSAIPYLKKIIKDHPLLSDISLDYNDIDDNALKILLTDESLEFMQRIKSIRFRFFDNKITENGVDFAFNKLSTDSLSSTLSYNKVNEETKKKYRKIIKAQTVAVEHSSSPPLLYSAVALKTERADQKTNPSESKSPQKPTVFS